MKRRILYLGIFLVLIVLSVKIYNKITDKTKYVRQFRIINQNQEISKLLNYQLKDTIEKFIINHPSSTGYNSNEYKYYIDSLVVLNRNKDRALMFLIKLPTTDRITYSPIDLVLAVKINNYWYFNFSNLPSIGYSRENNEDEKNWTLEQLKEEINKQLVNYIDVDKLTINDTLVNGYYEGYSKTIYENIPTTSK